MIRSTAEFVLRPCSSSYVISIKRNIFGNRFNRFGLSFIELCCTYSIHVFNGRLFDDIPGNYTCLANNGASVIDYMAATTSLFKYVTHFKIDDNDVSVHFLIICHFSFPTKPNLNNHIVDSEETMSPWLKYKWKPEL